MGLPLSRIDSLIYFLCVILLSASYLDEAPVLTVITCGPSMAMSVI